MAAIEFGVAVFGDWLGDTARHLYVFHTMCDVLIVVDVAWAVDAAARRRAVPAGAPEARPPQLFEPSS
jgi:hypothetical protein